MENRDRDKVSQSKKPTEAGNVNRDVSRRESEESGNSSVDFGEKIGQSEDLENEPSRRSGNMGSSGSSRRGSSDLGESGDLGSSSSDIGSGNRSSSSGMGKSNKQIDESDRSGSSRGEH